MTIKAFPGEQVTLRAETGYQVVYFNNGNHHIVVDGFIIDATGAPNGVKVTYSSAGSQSSHSNHQLRGQEFYLFRNPHCRQAIRCRFQRIHKPQGAR